MNINSINSNYSTNKNQANFGAITPKVSGIINKAGIALDKKSPLFQKGLNARILADEFEHIRINWKDFKGENKNNIGTFVIEKQLPDGSYGDIHKLAGRVKDNSPEGIVKGFIEAADRIEPMVRAEEFLQLYKAKAAKFNVTA